MTRVRRRLELNPGIEFSIDDEAEGRGTEHLTWRLHLGRFAVNLDVDGPGRFRIRLGCEPSISVTLSCPEAMHAAVIETEASERYGERHLRPTLVLSGSVALPASIRAVFSIDTATPPAYQADEPPTRTDTSGSE